jgi:hypothetical protein
VSDVYNSVSALIFFITVHLFLFVLVLHHILYLFKECYRSIVLLYYVWLVLTNIVIIDWCWHSNLNKHFLTNFSNNFYHKTKPSTSHISLLLRLYVMNAPRISLALILSTCVGESSITNFLPYTVVYCILLNILHDSGGMYVSCVMTIGFVYWLLMYSWPASSYLKIHMIYGTQIWSTHFKQIPAVIKINHRKYIIGIV